MTGARVGELLDERVQAADRLGKTFEQRNALLSRGTEFSCHVRKIVRIRILNESPCATDRGEANVRRLKAYAPAILWAAVLLFLGGQSDVPSVETNLPLDKAAHFLFYGVLGALAIDGWRRAGRWPAVYLLIFFAILVGAADELNQSRIAGRSADLFDWFADTAGIFAGGLVAARFARKSMNAN